MTLPSPTLTAASFAVAVVVGLTGMGGGALMTPILVFFFGIPPLTAVGSDLVVSAVTKPFGAVVHLRRGTVNLPIAGWMCIGSVPRHSAGCSSRGCSEAAGPCRTSWPSPRGSS